MKTLAVLLVVCVAGAFSATLTDSQKAKLAEHKNECIAQSGADKTAIDGIIKGGPITPDEKLNCFAYCMLEKIDIMDKEGNVHVDKARERAAATNVDAAKANAVIDKCKDLKGNDKCETGGKIFTCFIQSKDFAVLD